MLESVTKLPRGYSADTVDPDRLYFSLESGKHGDIIIFARFRSGRISHLRVLYLSFSVDIAGGSHRNDSKSNSESKL